MTPCTNRQLYLAIHEIAAARRCGRRDASPGHEPTPSLHGPLGEATENPNAGRSLENYLLALLRLTQSCADKSGLTVDEFLALLAGAFAAEPLPFQSSWLELPEMQEDRPADFERWKSLVIAQIIDLHQMDENGDLRNEYRYGGIDSPRGNRWYNFDPSTYLECAAAGSIGGKPGDERGRAFMPGPSPTTDSCGNPVLANPADVELPNRISWEFFVDFLECGQQYE